MDVLKISNTTEQDKIEQWTVSNTFPNVIKFVIDTDGNFIVGKEVLTDPAYQKLGIEASTKLCDYLQSKTATIVYKAPQTDVIKDTQPGTK